MRVFRSWRGLVVCLSLITGLGAGAVVGGPRVVAMMRNQPPHDLGQAVSPLGPTEQVLQPQVANNSFGFARDDFGPAAVSNAALLGIDAAPAGPPPLASISAFQPLAPPAAGLDAEAIDAATLARLQQIRQRLEDLGADYVIVETTDGTGRYRFHCRMLVDERSRFMRPFESISSDPLAAGEAVLREVEAWRTAATTSTSTSSRLE